MKHEGIKTILKSFLKEKQNSSYYDDIDGISFECPESMSGGAIDSFESSQNGLLEMEHHILHLPLDELNAYLEPALEDIAVGIGRQLSQMSDEFESDHTDAVQNLTSANGVQFKEHIVRVSPKGGYVQISVIQTNSADSLVEVEWRTCDKSAKAGLHYVNGRGNICFAIGEKEKSIKVEIISNHEQKSDISFAIELLEAGKIFNTLMVYIVDDSNLYAEEKQIIKNIFDARHISVAEIATRLKDNVTPNTFKAALQCLSSSADSIPKELTLASELFWLTAPHARFSTLTKVFCEFFSDLPELEDMVSMF